MVYIETKKTEFEKLQVAEAITRMESLHLLPNVVSDFKKSGKLYRSERGILFPLSEEEMQMVREWEEETESVVYHVSLDYLCFGKCYSFLYVSKYQEEWERDNIVLGEHLPFVYVKNMDCEWCSEYGTIEIVPVFGGIARVE